VWLAREQRKPGRQAFSLEATRGGVQGREAVSDQAWPPDPDATSDGSHEGEWETPRWRESDANQAEVEHDHRLHDDPSPVEHGAIDKDNSVGRARTGKARPPR
jgi:hypothetical protein